MKTAHKFPWQANGVRYGIGNNGERICTGAMMGRADQPFDKDECREAVISAKLRLRRVPAVDGDYDQGGAYWGGIYSRPLYCAWNKAGAILYVRARDWDTAKREIQSDYPRAVFFK